MSLGHKSVPQSLITTIEITKLRLSNCSVGNQIQNLRWPPNFGTPSKAWPKTFNQSYLFLLPPWDNFSDFSLLRMVWLRTSSLTFKGWFPYFVLFSAYKESTVLFCFVFFAVSSGGDAGFPSRMSFWSQEEEVELRGSVKAYSHYSLIDLLSVSS